MTEKGITVTKENVPAPDRSQGVVTNSSSQSRNKSANIEEIVFSKHTPLNKEISMATGEFDTGYLYVYYACIS